MQQWLDPGNPIAFDNTELSLPQQFRDVLIKARIMQAVTERGADRLFGPVTTLLFEPEPERA